MLSWDYPNYRHNARSLDSLHLKQQVAVQSQPNALHHVQLRLVKIEPCISSNNTETDFSTRTFTARASNTSDMLRWKRPQCSAPGINGQVVTSFDSRYIRLS